MRCTMFRNIPFKNPLTICGIFFLVLFSSAGQVKMKTFKITEGVKAALPADFLPMTDDDMAVKYPSSKKPLAMFTSPDRLADFGLNVSKSKWPGNDLKLLQQIYKSTITEIYNKVEYLQEGIKTINKRDFIVFEFVSQFESQKHYTYLQYTVIKDQVYLFNFSCPAHLQQQWQPAAAAAMNSIKMNIKTPIEIKPVVKEGVKKYKPKKVLMKTK